LTCASPGHDGSPRTLMDTCPPDTYRPRLDNSEQKVVVRELAQEGVTAAELPLWAGAGTDGDLAASPARAIAAGLRVRPLAQTVREVHEHELTEPFAGGARVWLAPARERELLAFSG